MNVTIIGTGEMARSLGVRFVRGAHSVTVLGRDENNAELLAQDLRDLARGGALVRAGWLAVARLADPVVVLAVPYAAALAIIDHLREQLSGRVVVDVTNQLPRPRRDARWASGAEELASRLPAGAILVKAFNSVAADALLTGQIVGQPLDVLIAGDDSKAKETVAELARDGGMVPLDVGPLAAARDLEGLARLKYAARESSGSGKPRAWKLVG
jgi:8-hydroxy-5-deazaflavin:NADPH oxidoreductase